MYHALKQEFSISDRISLVLILTRSLWLTPSHSLPPNSSMATLRQKWKTWICRHRSFQKPIRKEAPFPRLCYALMKRTEALTLEVLSCVTLDEILNLSGPLFPFLWKRLKAWVYRNIGTPTWNNIGKGALKLLVLLMPDFSLLNSEWE